ncbi:hypothetical protein PsorP6_001938 [Peronosclerospora sorghi]|uniref:Uncharacterized protein n=1 Tax=Peronosclerospora sorghi TaxID=230839 RepID=A0ACC0WR74_9STRA|nr:hypothetical protein PsorP6_001938 [Peronosclerospora sorghi]
MTKLQSSNIIGELFLRFPWTESFDLAINGAFYIRPANGAFKGCPEDLRAGNGNGIGGIGNQKCAPLRFSSDVLTSVP